MNVKSRDFQGYRQYKIGRGPWQFEVQGFDGTASGEAGVCYVEMADGSNTQVPIDEKDRLLINGKKYGRTHWHH